MTIAELNRVLASRNRVKQQEAKERAYFDYILADIIGRSISRVYSKKGKLPEISDIYPNLFNKEEIKQKQAEHKARMFALKLKEFANFHNAKYEEANDLNE